MEFNIKKIGNRFVAFDKVDKKRSYGSISIKTKKFIGDTRCLISLHEHLDNYIQTFIDKALTEIVADVNGGDLTAIEGLLKVIPLDAIKDFLPEKLG